MSQASVCTRCGSRVGAEEVQVALAGVCPSCLARELMGSDAAKTEVSTPRPVFAPKLEPESPQSGRLGPWRLLKKLGEGGMGTVYLAEGDAGGQAAVKVLPKQQADSDALHRFRREARAAVRLRHPNLVRGWDAGEDRGHPYFVMEYCDGESLEKRLRRDKAVPWGEALRIAIPVARALEYVHGRGLVHRDVKPSNIMVTKAGVPKLLDLGIAKDLAGGEASFVTRTGAVLGTPQYLSPEQARGEREVDGRSDVFSLGATLYHLVTGRPPFSATTLVEVVAQHLNAEIPDPRTVKPDLPEPVALLLGKMLAKSPANRHGSAAELAGDLKRALAGKAPAGRWRRALRVHGKWVAGACAAVLLGAFLLFRGWAQPETPPVNKTPAFAAASPEVSSGKVQALAGERKSAAALQGDQSNGMDAPLKQGLVGYWKFDEPGGPTRDSSGCGNHTSYTNNPAHTSEAPKLRFENRGALTVDPNRNQWVSVAHRPSLSLTGSFSLSVWIRPAESDRGSLQGIIEKHVWNGDVVQDGTFLRLDRAGNVAFGVASRSGGAKVAWAFQPVSPKTWSHVAAVYDVQSRTARTYLNGRCLTVEFSVQPAGITELPLQIGAYFGQHHFDGDIDEIRVYNRALSEEEVKALAEGNE